MVNVIVPTLNAAKDWPRFAPALLACVRPEQVLILDSESTDGTHELADAVRFQVRTVKRDEFNHGGTRQMAVGLVPSADILIFLTQDAVLTSPNAIENIVAIFDNLMVGAAYGRQLHRPEAGAIEAHAREFNYPAVSDLRDLDSRDKLGFKSIFLSNSFAAYRRSALMEIGGFPTDVIFGEDTVTAARLLLAKYKIAYVADACVYHSHPHTWKQEFSRYFDIGVLHSRERWLLNEFGKTSGEGTRFVLSELRYLLKCDPLQIPSSLVRTGLKFLGYRLGLKEALFPFGIKRRLSMNHRYWG
jgi:rhamnosyltransferase